MLPRKIRKYNVCKAVELITKHKTEGRKKSKDNEKILNHRKILYQCKSFEDSKRRRMSTVGFSKSIALLEMQSYIARQDWRHASNLFLQFLENPVELEPLVWRYMFIMLLHINDPFHLCEFLEQCVGSRSFNNPALLEKFLVLPSKD